MLMFREEKSPEDEIKAWQFWHGRQHSVKQRILDAGNVLDTHAPRYKRGQVYVGRIDIILFFARVWGLFITAAFVLLNLKP